MSTAPNSIAYPLDPEIPGCDPYVFSTAYLDRTTVTTPQAIEVYHHYGNWINHDLDTQQYCFWKPAFVGLITEKRTFRLDHDPSSDKAMAREEFDWSTRRISNQVTWPFPVSVYDQDAKTQAPVLVSHALFQNDPNDAHPLTVHYEHFDDYGNPGTVIRSGAIAGDQVTEYTYYNNTDRWIIGRTEDETIHGVERCLAEAWDQIDPQICPQPLQDFVIDRTYDTETGLLVSENHSGVITRYTYHPSGELHTVTNANSHVIRYEQYHRGKPQYESHSNGLKIITRVINDTGTVAQLTNGRQFTTVFSYDDLNRLKSIQYPTHEPVSITWDTTQRMRTLVRGAFTQIDTFDGVGRIVHSDRNGIVTTTTYNALGQPTFVSYPGLQEGTLYRYDALGRRIETVHPDQTKRTFHFAYAEQEIVIEDELGHQTEQRFQRYGPNSEPVLIQSRHLNAGSDYEDIYTTIERNVLGRPLQIFQGELIDDELVGYSRFYAYNHYGFQIGDYHPEIGARFYTHDALGQPLTSQLRQPNLEDSGIIHFRYDELNRLEHIDYPEGTPDIKI